MLNKNITLDEISINNLRHNKERFLYIMCAILNTIIIVALLFGLIVLPFGFILNSEFGKIILAVIALFVVSFFSMGTNYARTRVNSVQISDDQFSELYEVVKEYSKYLGLKKIPYVYVKQDNGIINSFASYFWGRNYVLINTEFFEVAYLEHKDLDAVAFIIAHELAHIRLRHTRFWYNSSILIVKFIPLLGVLLSRAQEYSCDRIALDICPEGKHGIFTLLLGRHLYKYINTDKYLFQAKKTTGWFEVATNATSTHPIPTRRIIALYEPLKVGRLLF